MKNKKNNRLAFSLIELSVVILVIGILVIGVTQGSRIIRQSKLTSARSLTTSSPVNSISGLSMWLETSLDNSLNDSERIDGGSGGNGTIANWYDINPLSFNHLDLSQGTTANKPTYDASGINGLPTIRFDGVADYLSRTNVTGSNLSSSQQVSIFAVQKYSSPIHNSTTIMWQPVDCTNRLSLIAILNNNKIYFQPVNCIGTSDGNIDVVVSNFMDKPKILTGIRGFGAAQLRVNRQQVVSTNSMTAVFNTSGVATLFVGAQNATTNFLKGEIGEIIIFNRALSNAERDSVESYLAVKWGIQ
jgi:prepilin-type N-terminal cleavage/methylation domain-containing protein